MRKRWGDTRWVFYTPKWDSKENKARKKITTLRKITFIISRWMCVFRCGASFSSLLFGRLSLLLLLCMYGVFILSAESPNRWKVMLIVQPCALITSASFTVDYSIAVIICLLHTWRESYTYILICVTFRMVANIEPLNAYGLPSFQSTWPVLSLTHTHMDTHLLLL